MVRFAVPSILWILLGLAAGVLATALVARGVLRRSVDRAREAERRARGAERMAEIGAMTGGLAHEIKNPLSTIGLNAQLLEEGLGELSIDDADRTRLLRRVGALRREADRLRGILTDFLQFAGQLKLEPRPTDVNQLVDELVDFFTPQAVSQGIRLRADLAPAPAIADVDATHLKQAVLNLMINATHAMATNPPEAPRELMLKVSRHTAPPGKAPTGEGPTTDTVAIHVIDTGSGMNPETLAKIFDPYFTTKSGGSGLGLPTTKRLIQAHAGRIDVHSEPGRGTDFVISLPISTATAAAAPKQPAPMVSGTT